MVARELEALEALEVRLELRELELRELRELEVRELEVLELVRQVVVLAGFAGVVCVAGLACQSKYYLG
jgi:hypothetical protein